ncbi:MAG: alpha/beta fold hydrolase [Proteobacteria bacterium]|nr:alpha/beta fold hydrolase [Pseudomonadota bacterium]MBU1687608.1 alpha/beta fold hydrolase [Pseudomonadota bacterium]
MPHKIQITLFLYILCTGCMARIPMDQSQLIRFEQRSANFRLTFSTNQGQQVAYYLPPLKNSDLPPARLALLFPGISTQTLGWLDLIRQATAPDVGWLLIDYPGRGECQGTMNPADLILNPEGAIAALSTHYKIDPLPAKILLLGHSFGSGAVLQFAARHQVDRIVLVAPFDTLRRAVAQKSFILSIIMPAQIDNQTLLQKILLHSQPPEVTILHGALDTTLPVEMGRTLAGVDSSKITYFEAQNDDHVSILTTHRELIFDSLVGAIQYQQ